MIWLTPDEEYLVEGEGCRIPNWAGPVLGPGGDPVRPAKFYLVTPGGEVTRAFSEPIEYSIDVELGVTNIHAVSGGALLSYHVRQLDFDEPMVKSSVELTGLRAIEAGSVPFDLGSVIGAHEAAELARRMRMWEKDERERRQLQEELNRLREALQGATGHVHATWEFESGGWVVKRVDGSVLGRGEIRGYGRYIYRMVEAVMGERFGNDFKLELKLAPGEALDFWLD
jgi:hypothetical protein